MAHACPSGRACDLPEGVFAGELRRYGCNNTKRTLARLAISPAEHAGRFCVIPAAVDSIDESGASANVQAQPVIWAP